jgi:hypothetical protein
MRANAKYIHKGVIYPEIRAMLQQIGAMSSEAIKFVYISGGYGAP